MRTHVTRRIVLAALALIGPLACSEAELPTGPDNRGEPTVVVASSASLEFSAVADSSQLTAAVRDADGNDLAGAAITWANLDPAVATVSPSGWVVARGNGAAQIVASSGALADTVLVTVEQVATAVEVSPDALVLGQGRAEQLSAVVVDANGFAVQGAPGVEWSSADETVATVDAAGLVTAQGWGSQTVVSAATGQVAGEVAVSVLDQIAFRGYDPVDARSEIHVMHADGSGRIALTAGPGDDWWPRWSPDGTTIAFVRTVGGDLEIHVMNPDGSGSTRLTQGARDWLPQWSPDGSRIVFLSDRDGQREVYVMNADGSGQTNLTQSPGNEWRPVWSPDGTRIAFVGDGEDDLYLMNADGTGLVNLTQSAGNKWSPAWSPDGTKIAFGWEGAADGDIYVMNANGSGQTPLAQDPDQGAGFPAWSPDGASIAFEQGADNEEYDIHLMNADGSNQINLTQNGAGNTEPVWSPDGTMIAFGTDGGSHDEIYVVDAGGSAPVRLAQQGGEPAWRPRAK